MVDYFKVLEIEYGSDENLVKTAFRRKIKALHPDTGNYDEKNFSLVMEAYSTLTDREKRDKYYHQFDAERKSFTNKNPSNLLEVVQKRIIFPKRLDVILKRIKIFDKQRYHDAHRDFHEDLLILLTPEELIKGIYFYVNLPIRKVCPCCKGNSRTCYLCEGLGITTSSHPYKIELCPPIKKGDFIIPIKKKPYPLAYFLTKKLKIKISEI